MPDPKPSTDPIFYRWDVDPGALELVDRALAALREPDGVDLGAVRGVLEHLRTWLKPLSNHEAADAVHEASCPTPSCPHAREVVRLRLALGQARLAAELIVDGAATLLKEREEPS